MIPYEGRVTPLGSLTQSKYTIQFGKDVSAVFAIVYNSRFPHVRSAKFTFFVHRHRICVFHMPDQQDWQFFRAPLIKFAIFSIPSTKFETLPCPINEIYLS